MRAVAFSFILFLIGADAYGQAPAEPESWLSLESALSIAAQDQRPVLLYVHAPWCAPCRRLERDVLPLVSMDDVIKAALDLSARPEPGYSDSAFERIRSAGLDIPPTFALLEPDGDVKASITGFREPHELDLFLSLAQKISSSETAQ